MQLTQNAVRVIEHRCLVRDAYGTALESPLDMFERVAHAVALAEEQFGYTHEVEKWEERFYSMLTRLEFLPNSPTLMNAGTELGQLSACFVLPLEDSLDAIFTTLHQTALIQQSGGGTGFNFSHLRPQGDLVRLTSGRTAGPLSFMRIFDTVTSEIRQGGKRRGANMGILDIHHPDIAAFINCKGDVDAMQNFNLSVAVTDAFMRAVQEQQSWVLKHPTTGKTVRRLPARKLWQQIIDNAWSTGDPGLIFIDEINRHNPTPALGKIEATNPCGEVPLLRYESCNLGSVNLALMTRKKKGKVEIDWSKLGHTVHRGVRFLDNVIEINHYLTPAIREMALGNRKIGLGVMGWADLLIRLEIPYDSREAVRLAGKLMQFIRRESLKASAGLAKMRGVFPNWKRSVHYPDQPLRNATVNSIAPTGSLSIIANVSSSIEPHFALTWHRKMSEGEKLTEVNPLLLEKLRAGKLLRQQVEAQLMRTGSIAGISEIPASLRRLFRTALEIPAQRHLDHQLAFQQYTDNAVSKTVNLPKSAPVETIDAVYRGAWHGGAKGITVYRDGSKPEQVFYAGTEQIISDTCCATRDSRIHGPQTILAENPADS